MQYGTPVMSSNVSSLPEIVGDAGILVDPLSVDELSGSIMKLLSSQKLREKLSKQAVVQARKYSWKDSALKTHNLFQALGRES